MMQLVTQSAEGSISANKHCIIKPLENKKDPASAGFFYDLQTN
ncbi:MAG: hypothetical protein ACI88G_000407 [Woeseiaceae bacterium]|jgi:hypothetical protein